MQTTINKDPYQLVCQAFERNELKELLLGEKDYRYKKDFRNDYTNPEEKTDILVICDYLIKYYLAHNKNPIITQKLTNVLIGIPQTHWGCLVLSRIINYEVRRRKNKEPNFNFDLGSLANHLKKIIQNHRTELIQEKQYGGLVFDQGMYESLTRGSAMCVENGGPAFIEDNPSANDHFEATTTFTLTLPNKLANLTDQLHNTFMDFATTILKGSPIPKEDGYIPAQNSSWTYTMVRQKQPTGETQFICMVNNIYADRTKLMNLIEKFGLKAQLNSIIWLENPNQRITIPSTALQKISEMNIPFSIEIQLKTTDL